jgi:hypothetical protein
MVFREKEEMGPEMLPAGATTACRGANITQKSPKSYA